MINPFESIDARLSNIENLLLDIKHQPKGDKENPDDLLTIEQAAIHLKVKVATVYGYVNERVIPHSKIKKRLYFSKKELTDWVRTGRKKTISEINSSAEESLRRWKK